MTPEELHQYWMPARRAVTELQGRDASTQLANVLGIPYPTAGHWFQLVLTDDLKRKLQMLAGPHGKTILKMMQLKKEFIHD